MKKIIWLLLSGLMADPLLAQDFEWMPDRRKDQFPTEQAHLIVPLPYSYPGIGEGVFLIGNVSNIAGSTMDGALISILGDVGGTVFQGDEIPLIENRLLLHVFLQDINRAVVNNYQIRGMDGSREFNLLDVSSADQKRIQLKYTVQDRRLNFFIDYQENSFALDAIRESDGDVIQQLAEPFRSSSRNTLLGFNLDYTDDYLDPRRGFRFELTYSDQPPDSADDPDFYTLDFSALLYIPYLTNDVLVLHYYQSDAHVRRAGNTDPASIRAELDLQCDAADMRCLSAEQQLVGNTINERLHGTANSLGGLDRLRSYPDGRFQGGHMAFIGAEYRWNMEDEQTPFNLLFWKDVTTSKQIALFAEVGTVAETSAAVWDEYRSSVGVGFRLITASGSVYRADFAYGDEGSESAVFFFYPWK